MKATCIHTEGLPEGELVLGESYEISKRWTDYSFSGGIDKVQVAGQNDNTWYLAHRFQFEEQTS